MEEKRWTTNGNMELAAGQGAPRKKGEVVEKGGGHGLINLDRKSPSCRGLGLMMYELNPDGLENA